jgi:hypothetical protein
LLWQEAKEVMKAYTTLMSSLDDYEHGRVEEWAADVERSSQARIISVAFMYLTPAFMCHKLCHT